MHTVLKIILSFLLCVAAFFYASLTINFPDLPEKGIKGTAFIKIDALTHKHSSFGNSWNYSGKIVQFTPEDSSHSLINHLSATLCLPDQESIQRPRADSSYLVQGRLKKTIHGKYFLSPEKQHPWYPASHTWSLAEWRFNAKQWVSQYIKQKIKPELVSDFLAGIATGDFENRLLNFEFSRFGLLHLMAISGFHFVIVAGILSFFLSTVIEKKVALVLLMVLMTGYFVFLGHAPSVSRAWVSCMIAFAALLVEKSSSGLNSLGIGLLVVLIIDPQLVYHLGFQFSFTVTAAILIWYAPIDTYLQTILCKKPLHIVVEMNVLNQYGLIILSFFRQALALMIAVNLIAIPFTLYYFHQFPLLSLLYNFFIPWMVSLSMFLLIGGFMGDLIHSFIGNLFHLLNEKITLFMLDYMHSMPHSLDLYVKVTWSQNGLILFFGVYFLLGLYLKHKVFKSKKALT